MIYQKQEPVHVSKKDTASASLLLYSDGKIWAINPTCSCNSKSPKLSFMSVFVNYILKNYVTYFLQMENTYLKEDDKGFLLCFASKKISWIINKLEATSNMTEGEVANNEENLKKQTINSFSVSTREKVAAIYIQN